MKGKDLINIGIFSAIYYVIVFIVAMLGFIPIFLPLLAVSVVSGLLAELVYKNSDYKSASRAVITNGVFSLWIAANYLPLFFAAEKYWSTRQNFGQDYIDTVTKLMPKWMCPVMFAAAFICGVFGGLLGKALMKKHFEKAGIA